MGGQAWKVSWKRYTSSSEFRWSSYETNGPSWHATNASWNEDANATRNANASRYGTTRDASWYGSSSWHDGRTSWYATSNGHGNASWDVPASNVIEATNICVMITIRIVYQ